MYLTADEKETLVSENEVTSEGSGGRRWSETMETVVKADDGKLYRIEWERGLTEHQDDYFEDGEVPEVFSVKSLEVSTETLYLTEDEQKADRPTLAQKMVADQESYSIVTGKELRDPISAEIYAIAKGLRELLPQLEPLDLAAGSSAHRAATEQYLDALIALKEGAN